MKNLYTQPYIDDFDLVLKSCKDSGIMDGDFPYSKDHIKDAYVRFCASARKDKSIVEFIKFMKG